MLHVLKFGCRWRNVPAEYDPAKTVYNRYHRWAQRRIWHRIFESVAASGSVPQELSIDRTFVKAYRSAQGSKGGHERKRLVRRAAEEQAKSIASPMIATDWLLSALHRETS